MNIKRIDLLLFLAVVTFSLILTSSSLPLVLNCLITIPLLTILPGLLIWMRFYQHKHTELTKLFLFSVAIGIIMLFAQGLMLNWVLPLTRNIHDPLQPTYIFPVYIVSSLILFTTYLTRRGREVGASLIKVEIKPASILPITLPLLLPLLAVAGAFRLNNGANNILTITMLALIVGAIILYVWKPKLVSAEWLLFNCALALLLSTSMRSWYITGFDVSQEFQVFSLTLHNHFWDLRALPGNAYNACLSLTILPTILQQMTGIAPEYIFKFTFQVIFALTAVVVYLISRAYTDKRLAFLASIFYISQTQFISSMYAIGRQELALFFFGLLLILLTSKQHLSRNHKTLAILVSIGMVLSHYSTSYVAIVIIAIGSIITFFINIVRPAHERAQQRSFAFTPGFGIVLVIYLTLLSIIWYSQINLSSGNVTTTLSSSLASLGTTFSEAGRSPQVLSVLTGITHTTTDTIKNYQQDHNLKTALTPVPTQTLPVKNVVIEQIANISRLIALFIVKIVLPLSPFILLCIPRYHRRMYGIAPLAIGSVAIIGLLIALPLISYDYNLERAYQQGLMLLALPTIFILSKLLPIKKKAIRYAFVTFLIILYFIMSPGSELANQVAGGIDPPLNMNNTGSAYQEYYTRTSEVDSAHWMAQNCANATLYADRYASLRLTAYGTVPFDSINPDILNTTANSCTLLDYTNVINGIYYGYLHKQTVTFSVNQDTFSKTNNRVYSNGQSVIYSR